LTPDVYSRTSDHFELISTYAEQIIKQGDAYCDCTPTEEVRKLREERQPSAFREQSIKIFLVHILSFSRLKLYIVRGPLNYLSII